ncbi:MULTISPECIES: hypothetical protein [Clostridium]|uniref:hypothetical protein n=1 Tax=Clostridium TaxID=1485 RepID=UPI000C0807C4|nr:MULTISPECIES: hypothetical protein [Clostridium]MDB1933011.1 hypothetical protein [Clostridium tertium]MDB1938371.1 hypothetical protein [Clostridium tertium]MDU6363067.1 hypothetical protein [Clostridium sp.]
MVSIKKLKKIVKKEIITRKNVGDKAPTHPKLVKPMDCVNKQHPPIHPSNTQNKSKVMESNQIVKKIRKGE